MLRMCIALLAVSVIALAAASCAQTGAAMAAEQSAQVAAVAATQVSNQVEQQATQIVNNVENGVPVSTQQILPMPPGQHIFIAETTDAWVIVQNGVETIVFKSSAWDKYQKLMLHTK